MAVPEDLDFYTTLNQNVNVTYKQTKKVKKVNQYILGKLIGEGTYAKVKEAIDTKTKRRVAIKIIKKRRLRTIPNGEQNVKREIAFLQKLKHKNVVELIEVVYNEENEGLYIVMEYVGGGSLESILKKAPNSKLPINQIYCILSQLLDGLEYIHSQGIVHRDIKPANIMLTTEGIVKISDFGIAVTVDISDPTTIASTNTMYSLGSPAFQPPEIANGSQRFSGFAGDIWALGIVLYQIVTGEFPFDTSNVFNLFDNISKGNYTIPNWVDTDLANLIHGLLNLDPKSRLGIIEIKKHKWLKKKPRKSSWSIRQMSSDFDADFIKLICKENEVNQDAVKYKTCFPCTVL